MWWQRLAFLVGVGLMGTPAVLGMGREAADLLHVVGPIAAAVGFVAASEVTRAVRHANLATGLVLVSAPAWVSLDLPGLLVCLITGVALAALSFAGGRTTTAMGGGWRSLIG
jgi:hypothetical protein